MLRRSVPGTGVVTRTLGSILFLIVFEKKVSAVRTNSNAIAIFTMVCLYFIVYSFSLYKLQCAHTLQIN